MSSRMPSATQSTTQNFPFDLIPDKTPFLGFVDDATIVGFVADKTRQTLDDFMMWETIGVRNLG